VHSYLAQEGWGEKNERKAKCANHVEENGTCRWIGGKTRKKRKDNLELQQQELV